MTSAIIIGAGPAGSAAAAALARHHWHVTLIEARPFPRVKVCGEFISPAAAHCLHTLLPQHQLERLGAARVQRLMLHHADRHVAWTMPHHAWVLSRAALDTALRDIAVDSGATLLQPATVNSVTCDHRAAAVTLADATTITADIVIHADGHARLDAHPANPGKPHRPTPARRGVLGHKCHLILPPHIDRAALHMHATPGAYFGLVAIENNRATIAMVARAKLLAQHNADLDQLLHSRWPDYRPQWRCSPWLSCAVAGAPYAPSPNQRAFRVGNAAAAVEPLGGEGIGLALWSASTLSQLLITAAQDDPALATSALHRASSAYARAYRARLRFRRPASRLAAELLMRPRLVAALWPLVQNPALRHALIAPWYAMTGKRPRPLTT